MEAARVAPADATIQKRLFHAQRNLYMVGMVVILYLVIVRISKLIHGSARYTDAAVASVREAQTATKAAEILADSNPNIVVKEIQSQITELRNKVKEVEGDRDILKTQAKNLQKQYNDVSERLRERIGGDSD